MSLFRRIGSMIGPVVALSTLGWLPTAAAPGEVTYDYDDAGRLKRVIYPNTTQRTYRLDAAGNRTNVDVFAGGGRLEFAAPTASISEGTPAPFTINVTRAGSTTGAISVSYATASGTAISGSDFTAASGTLNWAAGDGAAKPISVPITGDSVLEPGETFTLSLSSPGGGAVLGSGSQTVVTIVDDDPVTFSVANVSPGEAAGSVTLTVTKTGATTLTHSVSYATANGSATAGSDYVSTSGTLNFGVSDTSKTFVVTLTDDAVYEGNETFTANLSGPTNGATLGTAAATVTIVENDPAPPPGTLSLAGATALLSEVAGTPSFLVNRTGGSFGTASVLCSTGNGTAVGGSDYTAVSQTLTWANGDAASKSCSVPIIDDAVYEGTETFSVNLSNATGATLGTPSTAIVTIVDNDPQPLPGTLRVANTTFTVAENGGSFTFVVTRTGTQGAFGPASVQCRTGDFSAVSGVDYVAMSRTLNWAAGDAADKTCVIQILNDAVHEEAEGLWVYIENAVGAALDVLWPLGVQINDDDPVPPQTPAAPTWTSTFQPCTGQWGCELPFDVFITWNAVSGANYYELERAPFGTVYVQAYSGSATTFHEFSLDRSIQDYYRVRACNGAGCGAYSVVMILTQPFP